MTAGTQTSAGPTPGMIEPTIIRVPQNTACPIPATQKASPPSVPCTTPITSVPLIVARATETNLPIIRSLSAGGSGI